MCAAGLAAGAAGGALWPGAWPLAVAVALPALACAGATRPLVAALAVTALLGAAGFAVASMRVAATGAPGVPGRGDVQAEPAEVEQAPARTPSGWRYAARLTRAGEGWPSGTRVLVRQGGGEPPAPGDVVALTGTLGPAVRPDAPGWWRRYVERNRIAASVRVRDVDVVGRRGGWRGTRDGLARALRRAIDARIAGDEGAVVSGITLGFDERLSEARRAAFRESGTAHLLAVSGQNVALVGLAVMGTLVALGAARAWSIGVGALAVLAYALLCQPGASVVRATLVGLLALWAMAAGRPARSAYPLLVAFGAMIAWTPRSISDPGLILSFSAVVGILVLAEPLRRALVRVVPAPVAVALAVSAAATLATAPASALIFGQVSLVGLVANLVAVPVAGIVLVAGLTGALTACVAPAAGALPLAAAGGGAHVLVLIADAASGVPVATVGPREALGLGAAAAALWAMWRVGSGHAAGRRPQARVRDLR